MEVHVARRWKPKKEDHPDKLVRCVDGIISQSRVRNPSVVLLCAIVENRLSREQCALCGPHFAIDTSSLVPRVASAKNGH